VKRKVHGWERLLSLEAQCVGHCAGVYRCLDLFTRLLGSLSANLQRFGMERVAKVESLQEIIEEMREGDGETKNNG
jgi:hypothetical protein